LQNFGDLTMNSPSYSYIYKGITYSFQFTAVGSGPTVTIDKQATGNFDLTFNSTTSSAESIALSQACYNGGVTLFTTGQFDSTTSAGQAYTIPIGLNIVH
jgi:hypothetical protein